MKIILLLLLILITGAAGTFAQEYPESKLGFTKEFIKKNEKGTLVKEESSLLAYESKAFNWQCQIIYQFVNDSLAQEFYYVTQTDTLKRKLLNGYNNFKRMLNFVYGSPSYDSPYWVIPGMEGGVTLDDAILKGYAVMGTSWALGNSMLILTISLLEEGQLQLGWGFVLESLVKQQEEM